MDGGAKGFFRKLKRLQFWIICPFVMLLGFIGWWMAVGAIQKERDSNRSKINGYFSTLNGISGKDRHANDQVSEGMEQLIDKKRDEVAEAWTERWNQQSAKADTFKWPEKLGKRFISKVENLRPIETTVGFPVPPELSLNRKLRGTYRDFIKEELPKLAEHIDSEWQPGARRGGREARPRRQEGPRRMEGGPRIFDEGGRADGPTSAFSQSLVEWNPNNQQEIESEHFDWQGAPPNLLQILYAHEDLTVFRSIMNVIQNANDGAKTRFNAAVKEIDFIRIGKNVDNSAGHIRRASELLSGAGPGGPMPGANMGDLGGRMEGGRFEGGAPMEGGDAYGGRMEGGRMEGDGPGRMEGVNMFAQGASVDPADMRYVASDYTPLPAATLRSVLKKAGPGQEVEPIDPQFAYLAVAKRIPVRMRLRVDQRKLNRVLAECANSELTIEIRQIRINPDMVRKTSSATNPRRRGPRREGGPRQSTQSNDSEELFQYDVDVELYGIVYVYNPVNNEVLGIQEESTEEAAGEEDQGVPVAAT